MRDEVQWLLLGAALGNSRVLADVLAVSPHGFDYGRPRQLFAALGLGGERLRLALSGLGVVQRDSLKPIEAILEHVRDLAAKREQLDDARAVTEAAALMKPEDFQRFVRERFPHTTETRPAVAGKVG